MGCVGVDYGGCYVLIDLVYNSNGNSFQVVCSIIVVHLSLMLYLSGVALILHVMNCYFLINQTGR